MKESDFQKQIKNELKNRFPGCIVKKNDPSDYQGFPDLLILFKNMWATLEVKRSKEAAHRPNQDLYVERLNKMGFSSFIFPENREDVMEALNEYFNKDPKLDKYN